MSYGKPQFNKRGATVHYHDERSLNVELFSHAEDGCKGGIEVFWEESGVVPVDAIGAVKVPFAFFWKCKRCKATFFLPGFRELIEHQVAASLALSFGRLSKRHIRFLRLHFDKTQEEMAAFLGIQGASNYAKFENPNVPNEMGPRVQAMLKLNCLGWLKVPGEDISRHANMMNYRRNQLAVPDLSSLKLEDIKTKLNLAA
jgi:hypothetical protein